MKRFAKTLNGRLSLTGLTFVAPSFVCLLLFYMFPLLVSAFYAFYDSGRGFGLENFEHVFASDAFRIAFWNTWKLFAIGISALVVLSLVFALLLSNLGRYNPRMVFVFLSILLLPIVVPSSVTGLFIQEAFGSTGIVNGLITAKGAAPVNFLNSPLSFWVLLILYIWKNIGIANLLFYARINTISKEVVEAARIDGANTMQQVFRILIPQLHSAFLFVFVIGIWGVFKMSRESYLIFGNYTYTTVYGLQNFLNNHFQSANYSILSAASMVFLLMISVVLLVPLALDREGK